MPTLNPLWQTEEQWREYVLQRNYDERNPKSLVKSKDKDERRWYNKGNLKKWAKDFSFQRIAKWKTEEQWKQYGLERGYDERNPYSFRKSKDKEERSWYQKGNLKKWAKNFPFTREKERYGWQTEEQWKQYGLERGYDERNPKSLEESKDKEERSWYQKGNLKKWAKDFSFQRIAKWKTEEQWKQYGLERGYDERNPQSLVKSKDKDERSWYAKGKGKKWVKNFPFSRKIERYGWQTEEQWKQYGLQSNYDQRNPKSLVKSKDKEERRWYNKGNLKKWVKDFPFQRKRNHTSATKQQLEAILDEYIEAEDTHHR